MTSTPPIEASDEQTQQEGEPRLPLVLTLVVATVIPLLLPDELLPGPRWLFPVIILVLMTAMLILDPGRLFVTLSALMSFRTSSGRGRPGRRWPGCWS